MVMANALAELSSRYKNFSRIYWLKLLKDGSATFPPKKRRYIPSGPGITNT